MNKDIKDRWIQALRSGEYKQGQDYLRDDDKFCCLGVLCELAVQDDVIEPARQDSDSSEYYYGVDNMSSVLPVEVMEWAGLDSSNPVVVFDQVHVPISDPNDSGVPFSAIADVIEEQL